MKKIIFQTETGTIKLTKTPRGTEMKDAKNLRKLFNLIKESTDRQLEEAVRLLEAVLLAIDQLELLERSITKCEEEVGD